MFAKILMLRSKHDSPCHELKNTTLTDCTGTVSHNASSRPIVAIIGRPNVGKSTLFNRMLGKRTAIVDDVPGVTRDRNYADATYRNRPFRLVDTGGLDPSASEGMLALIKRQSELAIAEADTVDPADGWPDRADDPGPGSGPSPAWNDEAVVCRD